MKRLQAAERSIEVILNEIEEYMKIGNTTMALQQLAILKEMLKQMGVTQ